MTFFVRSFLDKSGVDVNAYVDVMLTRGVRGHFVTLTKVGMYLIESHPGHICKSWAGMKKNHLSTCSMKSFIIF